MTNEISEAVSKQIGDAADHILDGLSKLKTSHELRKNRADGEEEEPLEDGLAELLEVIILFGID